MSDNDTNIVKNAKAQGVVSDSIVQLGIFARKDGDSFVVSAIEYSERNLLKETAVTFSREQFQNLTTLFQDLLK